MTVRLRPTLSDDSQASPALANNSQVERSGRLRMLCGRLSSSGERYRRYFVSRTPSASAEGMKGHMTGGLSQALRRAGTPAALGLQGLCRRLRTNAAAALALGPLRSLSRSTGTITTQKRRRKATGRGTWRDSFESGNPSGTGVGRVCWVAGGLLLVALHGRWLVDGATDRSRFAGSTGFGPVCSTASKAQSGWTPRCSERRFRPPARRDMPRHGVDGAGL